MYSTLDGQQFYEYFGWKPVSLTFIGLIYYIIKLYIIHKIKDWGFLSIGFLFFCLLIIDKIYKVHL